MKYYFNTDFEFQLFDKNFNSSTPKMRNIREEFEYLFFWIENNKCLKTNKFYAKEYLDYLQLKTKHTPLIEKSIVGNSDIAYWGDIVQIEKSRLLNSKLSFYKMLEVMPLLNNRFFKVIASLKEVELKNLTYPIIVKSPFMFSGIGHIKIKEKLDFENHRKKIETWLGTGPIIIEEYIERVLDFGISIDETIRVFENKIGGNFQYQGSTFNPSKVYNEILEGTNQIKEYYLGKYGIEGPWSIDCMQASDGRFVFHEVNARKSMGWVFRKLIEIFATPHEFCAIQFVNSKYLKSQTSFSEFANALDKDSLLLSPITNQFVTYFTKAKNEIELGEKIKNINNTLFNL